MTTILVPRDTCNDVLTSQVLAGLNRSVVYALPLRVAKKARPIDDRILRFWGRVDVAHQFKGNDFVFDIVLWNVLTGESYYLSYTLDAPGYSRKGRRPVVGDAVSVLIWYEGKPTDCIECIHLEVITDSPQACVESSVVEQSRYKPQHEQ